MSSYVGMKYLVICCAVWAQSLAFDDIPVENYDHGEVNDNFMDEELLPRSSRSSDSLEYDPKENFFRYNRAYNGENDYIDDNISAKRYRNLPQPGGFSNYYEKLYGQQSNKIREKRDTNDKVEISNIKIKESISENIEKHLGKPLELAILVPENSTDPSSVIETTIVPNAQALEDDNKNVLINDFIRFKREAAVKEGQEIPNTDKTNESADMLSIEHRSSASPAADDGNRYKRDKTKDKHSEKMLLADNSELEGTREPRGTTVDKWITQPYPVERSDSDYNDNTAYSSENVRAPRVHFLTQRRSETLPPLGYNMNYEREARSRDLNRELSRDLARDMSRDMPTREVFRDIPRTIPRDLDREADYYQPRYTRHYDPLPPYRQRYEEPYFNNDDRDRFDSRYDQFNPYERDNRYNTNYRINKQKRIIYYATLPEMARSPPNVELRDRYNPRDRYDDNLKVDSYRFRKPYPKTRYEEDAERKAPYPLKVSTDVNVREIKKNPERRIYAEVDRNRYAYKTPSQYSASQSSSNAFTNRT